MTDDARGVSAGVLMPEPGAHSWYAIRCASHRERSVRAAFGLHAIPTFLPLYSETVRWSDRLKVVERLLFPGYLFVRVAAAEIPFLLSFAGVIGVLDSNLRPATVPDAEISNVERVISSLLPLQPCGYAAGDKVTIKQGALRGVSGVIVRHSGGARLIVNVAMLNRAVAVEIEAGAIAKEKIN